MRKAIPAHFAKTGVYLVACAQTDRENPGHNSRARSAAVAHSTMSRYKDSRQVRMRICVPDACCITNTSPPFLTVTLAVTRPNSLIQREVRLSSSPPLDYDFEQSQSRHQMSGFGAQPLRLSLNELNGDERRGSAIYPELPVAEERSGRPQRLVLMTYPLVKMTRFDYVQADAGNPVSR